MLFRSGRTTNVLARLAFPAITVKSHHALLGLVLSENAVLPDLSGAASVQMNFSPEEIAQSLPVKMRIRIFPQHVLMAASVA